MPNVDELYHYSDMYSEICKILEINKNIITYKIVVSSRSDRIGEIFSIDDKVFEKWKLKRI